jgi:hypothetical protein
MGTYADSKITVARKQHQCCSCLSPIAKGTEQLAYKAGLRSTWYVHLSCALGQFKRDGKWRCRAIETRNADNQSEQRSKS